MGEGLCHPERYVPGAFIKIGFFANEADLLYQDEVRGTLFEQVDKTIDLLSFKYLKAYISYYRDTARRAISVFDGSTTRGAVECDCAQGLQ